MLQASVEIKPRQVASFLTIEPRLLSVVVIVMSFETFVDTHSVVVCLHAAPRVQLFAGAGNGWPHNAVWYY